MVRHSIYLLGGNWTNNGGTFNAGTGTVTFNDTFLSFEYMDGTSPTTFNNLTINHTYPAYGITLSGSDATVNGSLALTSGKVALGNHNLTIGSGGSIAGYFFNISMIVPEGTGTVTKIFPVSGSASTFTFPVGNASGTAFYSKVIHLYRNKFQWTDIKSPSESQCN